MSNQVDEMARLEAEDANAANAEPVVEVTAAIEYVVSMEVSDYSGSTPGSCWKDIATVKVPPRTKRSTVIKQALREAGILPNADGTKPKLRALDVDSAEVHEPEAHQPAPEWRL